MFVFLHIKYDRKYIEVNNSNNSNLFTNSINNLDCDIAVFLSYLKRV